MRTVTRVPLSPAQQLLCWVDEVDPGTVSGPRFVAVAACRIGGPVDVAVLREALDDLVVRHEALRTVIARDASPPYQQILPPVPARLEVVPEERVIQAAYAADYPGTAAPLLWAYLGRDGGGDATLVLVAHHTVSDPWSMRLLMNDLMAGYGERMAGGVPAADAPRYADSVAAAEHRYGQRRRELALPYWRRMLADPPELPLPAAAPGGPPRTAQATFAVSASGPRLAAAARARHTTPFVLALAAFMATLRECCGAQDIAVPVLTYGRDRTDWETVGLFMNGLLVRADLTGDPGLAETVGRVHAAFAQAYGRELPLAVLLSELPEAARFFAPGGPVCAQFEVIQLPGTGTGARAGTGSPAAAGSPPYRPVPLPAPVPLGGPVLPVNGMAVWLEGDPGDGYTGTVRYRADRYAASTVDGMMRRYAEVLDGLVATGAPGPSPAAA